MKKHVLTLILAFVAMSVTFAQVSAPYQFNYQGVARDGSGNVLANTGISLRFRVRNGSASGTIEYQETHSVTTNQFGLFNLVIGTGTTTGSLSDPDWTSGLKFLQVEMDPAGGTNYVEVENSLLKSVPFALHSRTTDAVESGSQGMTLVNDGNRWTATSDLFHLGGNIGIGTTAPEDKLHVFAGNGQGIRISSPSYFTSSRLDFVNGDLDGAFARFTLTAVDETALRIGFESDFYTDYPSIVEFKSNGNVEVSQDLEVNGDANVDGNLVLATSSSELNRGTGTADFAPKAYGTIASDGSIYSGSGNFTCTWDAAQQRYVISVTGISAFYQNQTMLVSPLTENMVASWGTVNGDFLVYINNASGANAQSIFSFVLFAP